jgi:hypothetical protein
VGGAIALLAAAVIVIGVFRPPSTPAPAPAAPAPKVEEGSVARLVGAYFQAALQQTFEVEFVRQK